MDDKIEIPEFIAKHLKGDPIQSPVELSLREEKTLQILLSNHVRDDSGKIARVLQAIENEVICRAGERKKEQTPTTRLRPRSSRNKRKIIPSSDKEDEEEGDHPMKLTPTAPVLKCSIARPERSSARKSKRRLLNYNRDPIFTGKDGPWLSKSRAMLELLDSESEDGSVEFQCSESDCNLVSQKKAGTVSQPSSIPQGVVASGIQEQVLAKVSPLIVPIELRFTVSTTGLEEQIADVVKKIKTDVAKALQQK